MTKKLGFFVIMFCLLFAGFMLFTKAKSAKMEDRGTSSVEAPTEVAPAPTTVAAPQTQVPGTAPAQVPAPDTSMIKVKVLEEILDSRNDNDPRLDTDFKNLDERDKEALQRKYTQEQREKLNERGTIVYLLGREIKSSQDLLFIKQVAGEPTCSSFENCNASAHEIDDDHTGANELTLAYPQVMALKSLDRYLQTSPQDYSMKQQSLEIINDAARSKNEVVARTAQQILDNSGQN